MAPSQRPLARTSSTSTPVATQGTHVFKIAGYSLHRGLGPGQSIRSEAFAIGGLFFCVRFYPDGYSEDQRDYVAAFLHLLTKNARARATVEFRLVDQTTGHWSSTSPATPKVTEGTQLGTCRLMKRTELEASPYLIDDCLVIGCDVLLIKEPRVVKEETAAATDFEVQVPAPLSSGVLGKLKLIEEKIGVDVTFKVRDELFQAHKLVLAMRSPVFAAQFNGPMAEDDTRRRYIAVEDMHPQVFKALLRFIYTDAVPSMEDCCTVDDDERQEIIRHLLDAADRYALERLKVICEGILCKSLSADNVSAALALADEHHCKKLKEACVQFITSAKRINDSVVPIQGSMRLKRVSPASFVDMLWKVTGCMHGCFQFLGISRQGDI